MINGCGGLLDLAIRTKSKYSELSASETQHAKHSFEGILATPIIATLWERLPWLCGLLMVQSVSAAIMDGFEGMLQKHPVVYMFVPMLVGTGGNAGNQPGVTITRALGIEAGGDPHGGGAPTEGAAAPPGGISPEQFWALIQRESILALTVACVLGTIAFIRVIVEFPEQPAGAFVIALSLTLMILFGAGLGIAINLSLEKCGIDPAVAGAPIVSTVADLVGILTLCVVAILMLESG